MEFMFDLNDLLKYEITKITPTLIPPEFVGDRRKLWDTQSKLSDVINVMGEQSAGAQGLTKPITTAEKFKNSDHVLYFLIDPKGTKNKGSILGLLKMGRKGLYVFDRDGQHHQLKPLCVLDFYIHESMQRKGLGKKLFDYMLNDENMDAVKLAIDRPSEKFLAFLKKHYGLNNAIPQMNNFVVFDGFFPTTDTNDNNYNNNSNNNDNNNDSHLPQTKASANNICGTAASFGRYGAPRPPCSMAQIIHNHSSKVEPAESTTTSTIVSAPQQVTIIEPPSPKLERPHSLTLPASEYVVDGTEAKQNKDENIPEPKIEAAVLESEPKTNTTVKVTERPNNIIPDEVPVEYVPRTTPSLTEQGFYDLKFYHSRLW